jgi:hypothetical protein
MPAVMPAEVQNFPDLVKMRSASSLTRGKRRAKSRLRVQCVVAGRPSSKPVAARMYAPEQTLATRLASAPQAATNFTMRGSFAAARVPFTASNEQSVDGGGPAEGLRHSS